MPRRHRKGEGSLRYRKDLGMYEIRLTIGGKRKSFYSPGPRTRENEKRADLLRRKLALAYGITPNNPDNPPTLLEWLEAHAEAARAEGRRPNTLNSYARHIRLIAQHLGDPRLDSVTAERLEALFRALAQEGYSRSTVAQVRNLLHAAFERAVRYARLSENPVDRTRLPRFSKGQTGREIPEEELARILETAREHRLFAAFYLLAAYGLRRGEVLGLMWPDVDFEGGLLHIRRALVPDNRTARLILGPTKTSGSDRTLPLTEEAREVLLAHRERLEMDGLYHPEGFVFPSLAGTPVRPENLYRVWTRLLAKAGVPRARIHDLRGTFITRVVRETKNPKLAAVLAGHKSLTVAMQHYTRVSEQDLKTALKGLSLTRNNREDDKG